jgi:cyclase
MLEGQGGNITVAVGTDGMIMVDNEGKTEQEVLAAKPLADLDAKWAANEQQAQNWTRMVYNSFKRS